MQRRAAIWILGAFKTSPLENIEVIAGLTPIKLHLQKLVGRLQLHAFSLPPNHLIRMLMESPFGTLKHQHPTSLDALTSHQKALVKDHLVNSDNRFNRIFPPFSPLYPELSLGFRIIDNFSDCFSFNLCNKEKNNKICLQQLNNMVIELSLSPSTAIVITDTSIKNDIAISTSYMYIANSPLIQTLHHTVFVTSIEAKLFAIRYSINQASNKKDISKIIVITDSIHTAKKIFDPSSHPFQASAVAILSDLHQFFANN